MIAVLALVLGFLALLAVPVEVRFAVNCGEDRFSGRVGLSWLFGSVRVPLRGGGGPRERKPRPRAERSARKRPRRTAFGRRMLTVIRRPALQQRAARFLRDMVRCARFRGWRLQGRVGLDDPADTGVVWALTGPLIAWLGRGRGDVAFEVTFLEPCLDLDAQGAVRVVPLRVLYVALAFVLSPPVLRSAGVLFAGGRG